jgi:hypothetical protein
VIDDHYSCLRKLTGFLGNVGFCCKLVQAAPDPAGGSNEEDYDV